MAKKDKGKDEAEYVMENTSGSGQLASETNLPEPETPGNFEQGEDKKKTPEPSPLEEAEQKYTELNDRYLRLMAEYDNYRKRSTKEKSETYLQATAAVAERFLPVLDNLERAQGFEKATEEFAKGFDLICQSFKDVLKLLNIEEIGEVGEVFNPDLHNAVMHIEDPELGEKVVSQVLQKGYKIGGRIIRYAMVQTAN